MKESVWDAKILQENIRMSKASTVTTVYAVNLLNTLCWYLHLTPYELVCGGVATSVYGE